jgi:hypothetical protein
MNPRPPKSLVDLIGALCNEGLSTEDRKQLNECLKNDPIAQEEYLDQMLIEGLLQQELSQPRGNGSQNTFNAKQSVAPNLSRRRISLAIAATALATTFVMGSLGWWWLRHQTPPRAISEVKLALHNASFEDAASIAFQPTHAGWYGDAALAVKQVANVSPQHGDYMLQLLRSTAAPEDSCEVYQIVDLRDLPRPSSNQPMLIEASALVNSLAVDDSQTYEFAIHIFATPDNPLIHPSSSPTTWKSSLSYGGNRVTADLDDRSWQELNSVIAVDADTQFLLLQISVRSEDSDYRADFPGQFVDNVNLKLINALAVNLP